MARASSEAGPALPSRSTRPKSFHRRPLRRLLPLPPPPLRRPSHQNFLSQTLQSRTRCRSLKRPIDLSHPGHFQPPHHRPTRQNLNHSQSHDDYYASFSAAAPAVELEAPAVAGECTAAGSAERPPKESVTGLATAVAAAALAVKWLMRRLWSVMLML